VIVELLRMLGDRLAGAEPWKALVERYPLRRWDPERPARHAPAGLRQRRTAALRADLEDHLRRAAVRIPDGDGLRRALTDPWLDERRAPAIARLRRAVELRSAADLPERPAPEGDAVTVTIGTLRAFLEAPLQAWARQVLRLREVDDEDPVARTDEPLVTDIAQTAGLLRDVFFRYLRHGGSRPLDEVYRERIRLLRAAGAAPVAVFGALEERQHLDVLRSWQGQLREIGGDQLRFRPIGFGRAGERSLPTAPLPPLLLDVEVDGRTLHVELVGNTAPVAGLGGATQLSSLTSLILVARGAPTLKHGLRGALDQLVIAAAGLGAGAPHATTVLSSKLRQRHQHAAWSQADAEAHLRLLVSELLGASHDYLMPIDAVISWARSRAAGEIGKRVAAMRRNRRGGGFQRPEGYGPIERADGLDAPGDAGALAERRFGPLLDRMSGDGVDGEEDPDDRGE
jgi:hypothetical protein